MNAIKKLWNFPKEKACVKVLPSGNRLIDYKILERENKKWGLIFIVGPHIATWAAGQIYCKIKNQL